MRLYLFLAVVVVGSLTFEENRCHWNSSHCEPGGYFGDDLPPCMGDECIERCRCGRCTRWQPGPPDRICFDESSRHDPCDYKRYSYVPNFTIRRRGGLPLFHVVEGSITQQTHPDDDDDQPHPWDIWYAAERMRTRLSNSWAFVYRLARKTYDAEDRNIGGVSLELQCYLCKDAYVSRYIRKVEGALHRRNRNRRYMDSDDYGAWMKRPRADCTRVAELIHCRIPW